MLILHLVVAAAVFLGLAAVVLMAWHSTEPQQA
jgi:hypothetical protein